MADVGFGLSACIWLCVLAMLLAVKAERDDALVRWALVGGAFMTAGLVAIYG